MNISLYRNELLTKGAILGCVMLASKIAETAMLYYGGASWLTLMGLESLLMMAVYVSVFSLAVGVLYCIVSGLMAIDVVPRKATGAALGVVGISSYMTIGLQNIASGLLIDRFSETSTVMVDGISQTVTSYNFVPVAIFWLSAVLISFLVPILNWKNLKASS